MTGPPVAPRRSGLLVPIPEAEPIVGPLRQDHDPVARLGIPAHVTVLFPFVPAAAADDALDESLRALFRTAVPFPYRFARVGRFGDTTVYLEPEPSEPFSALTRRVVAQWPHYPPYEGVFDVVVPHLTVGDQLEPGTADLLEGEARAAMGAHGPIPGRCTEVVLMTEGSDARWSTFGRYPFGERGPHA